MGDSKAWAEVDLVYHVPNVGGRRVEKGSGAGQARLKKKSLFRAKKKRLSKKNAYFLKKMPV